MKTKRKAKIIQFPVKKTKKDIAREKAIKRVVAYAKSLPW